MLLNTVTTTSGAIFQLFLVCGIAAASVRLRVVSMAHVQGLSAATIHVFLPCLIISKTMTRFDPSGFALWWILPLSGVSLILAGMLFAALFFRLNPDKKPLLALASMQNAVYIVLPIAQILYPDQFDRFALYCFLLIIGSTPVMWSVGKVLLGSRENNDLVWKDFITPPFVAVIFAVIMVFTGLSSFVPDPVIRTLDLLGQATVPLAVFVLGATLSTISLSDMHSWKDIAIVFAVKYILVPGAVFSLLYFTGIGHAMPLFGSFIIIQAASPPATNLILIAENYGGDTRAISSMMLLMHIFCIFALPLWLVLWQWTNA